MNETTAQLRNDTETEFTHFRNFHNERHIVEDILQSVEPTDTFWDVGGNIGTYACLVGQLVDEIVVFEPFPENAAKIRRNLELNGLPPDAVREVALTDRIGTETFYVDPRAEAGAGQGSIVPKDEKTTMNVECTTGEEMVTNGAVAPDVMKIDVEGAELDVLTGMEDILSCGDCQLVYCEIHDTDWCNVQNLLERHGFSVAVIHESTTQAFLRAHRSF
ncbi:FkbM family methyltransferase [Halomontanus rarus]|uniref:FkbM family methyltransferase n=1 Tax=Halomontanus rarus TaxID=3034020 RepID=UPI001A996346